MSELLTEVERVARALWHEEAMRYADIPIEQWTFVGQQPREDFLREARAALKALGESRKDLEDEIEDLTGEINDVLQYMARRGYTRDKDKSLIGNLRAFLKAMGLKPSDAITPREG
jgi:hypothetical protein